MIGIPDDIGNPPPDSNASVGLGQPVNDGEAGVSVSCSVIATSNGAFSVQASISSTNPRVALSIQDGSVSSNGMGTARIGVSAIALPSSVLSPNESPCTLSVVPPSEDNIAPRAIWARFSCPRLLSPPNTSCVASGEFVLENCARE